MEESTSSSRTISEAAEDDDQNCRKITETESAAEDKISRLPNEILGHILSSFSTTQAIRTSILSKRWRYVWTFAPTIHICDSKLVYAPLVVHSHRETLKIKRKFIDFIDRVLHLNGVSCLQTLIFDCCSDYKSSRFSKLMCSLSMREAEVVSISFSVDQCVKLPPGCFTDKKLVDLDLGCGIVLNAPKSVHFPSLKILHLHIKHFFADDSMKNLLAGCPVLEKLNIERNEFDTTINTLYIQSSSLKHLEIDISDDNGYEICDLVVVIDTPNLKFLRLDDYATNNYKVSSMSSLGNVHLDLLCHGPEVPNGSMLAELLGKMSSTEYLHLTEDSFTHFTFAPLHNLPVFHNLTTLEMTFPPIIGEVWPYLLNHAPNLKKFFLLKAFSHRDRDYYNCQCEWHPPCYVPEGLSLHLEILTFFGLEPCAAEMEMVGYLLKNARVLKKMEIVLHGKPKENSKLCKELSMLPKGSAACEMQVRGHGVN